MESRDYAEWGLYIGVLVGLAVLHATGQGIILAICATSGVLIGALVEHFDRVEDSTEGF
jgi:hypothetical protein